MSRVIAVAGGSGQMGKAIIDAIRADNKFQVVSLGRKSAEATADKPQTIGVDYNDVAALVKILEENHIHTVISTLNTGGDDTAEFNLVEASDKSSVTKRFIPSTWGIEYTEEVAAYFPIANSKLKLMAKLDATSLEYTNIPTGLFADYFVAPHVDTYLYPLAVFVDPAHNTAAIPASGDVPVAFTHSWDTAKFVSAAMSLDKWEKTSYIGSDKVSWNQLVRLFEQAKGTKFTVKHDDMETLRQGQITELPSHPATYPHFPKEAMTGMFSAFGVMSETGIFDFKPEKTLSQQFPKIKLRSMKELIDAAYEKESDVAVLEAEPPGNPIEGIHQLQSELATQRDEIQALQRALARAQSHCRRVDDLLVDGKQRHTLVLNELDSARLDSNRANSHIAELVDALRSAYEQLDQKTLEASSLKEERSAATLMLPQGNKTEEDYLREVRELNQKIVDLAHQIVNRDGIASMLSGTSRQKRDFYQDWCVHLLWDQVFSVFCPGVNPTFAAPLGRVASKIPIIHRSTWRATTFTSIEKFVTLEKLMASVAFRALTQDCLAQQVNPETKRSLEEIIRLAVRVHFLMAKEGKNARVFCANTNPPLPLVPEEMEIAPRRHNKAKYGGGDDVPPQERPPLVTSCIGFGFAGSSGIEQKCLVLLEE